MSDVFFVYSDSKASALASWIATCRRRFGAAMAVEVLAHPLTGEQVVVCRAPSVSRLAAIRVWAEEWYSEDDHKTYGPLEAYCQALAANE